MSRRLAAGAPGVQGPRPRVGAPTFAAAPAALGLGQAGPDLLRRVLGGQGGQDAHLDAAAFHYFEGKLYPYAP